MRTAITRDDGSVLQTVTTSSPLIVIGPPFRNCAAHNHIIVIEFFKSFHCFAGRNQLVEFGNFLFDRAHNFCVLIGKMILSDALFA
jgi:hypothetical protein